MQKPLLLLFVALGLAFSGPVACRKNAAPTALTTRLTKANYDLVRPGMTKAQVEGILGPPTTVEAKDFVVYKRTNYRYQEGNTVVNLSFKNEELENKDTNLGTGNP